MDYETATCTLKMTAPEFEAVFSALKYYKDRVENGRLQGEKHADQAAIIAKLNFTWTEE